MPEIQHADDTEEWGCGDAGVGFIGSKNRNLQQWVTLGWIHIFRFVLQ